jgi:hypothetical protein
VGEGSGWTQVKRRLLYSHIDELEWDRAEDGLIVKRRLLYFHIYELEWERALYGLR